MTNTAFRGTYRPFINPSSTLGCNLDPVLYLIHSCSAGCFLDFSLREKNLLAEKERKKALCYWSHQLSQKTTLPCFLPPAASSGAAGMLATAWAHLAWVLGELKGKNFHYWPRKAQLKGLIPSQPSDWHEVRNKGHTLGWSERLEGKQWYDSG